MKKYAVITAISSYRMRYVVEMDEKDSDEKPYRDLVTCEEVEEFSQLHLGETIIDSTVMSEKNVIALFDKDCIENDSKVFLSWDDNTKLRNTKVK